jgi:HPt (histidine-containing phosphotransfer) domain-containing protein
MLIKNVPDKKIFNQNTVMEKLEKYTAVNTIDEELYNLSTLEEFDDNEYMVELLTALLKETPKDLKEMKGALQAGKIETVCQKAHKLKGSAGIIQAKKLTDLLEEIEVTGRKVPTGNELARLVEDVIQHYNLVENELKIHIEEFKQ